MDKKEEAEFWDIACRDIFKRGLFDFWSLYRNLAKLMLELTKVNDENCLPIVNHMGCLAYAQIIYPKYRLMHKKRELELEVKEAWREILNQALYEKIQDHPEERSLWTPLLNHDWVDSGTRYSLMSCPSATFSAAVLKALETIEVHNATSFTSVDPKKFDKLTKIKGIGKQTVDKLKRYQLLFKQSAAHETLINWYRNRIDLCQRELDKMNQS